MKKLLKELSKKEGKKVQVSLGNLKEVLSKLADLIILDEEYAIEFGKYLEKKSKKIKKAKK